MPPLAWAGIGLAALLGYLYISSRGSPDLNLGGSPAASDLSAGASSLGGLYVPPPTPAPTPNQLLRQGKAIFNPKQLPTSSDATQPPGIFPVVGGVRGNFGPPR